MRRFLSFFIFIALAALPGRVGAQADVHGTWNAE